MNSGWGKIIKMINVFVKDIQEDGRYLVLRTGDQQNIKIYRMNDGINQETQ